MSREDRPLKIGKKLQEEGFRLISDNIFKKIQNKNWEFLGQIYEDKFLDSDFLKENADDEEKDTSQRLKERCYEICQFNYSEENENVYLEARKWCVIPHTLRERGNIFGYTFLDIEGDKDFEIWELRAKSYEYTEGEEYIPIDSVNSIEEKIELLKRTSFQMLETFNYEDNAEIYWNTIKKWFVKTRP